VSRYHIARTDRRGAQIYVQSVDAIGADWNTARVPLTRAQVAAVVMLCDTRDLDIRDYETFAPIEVCDVLGYIGQDANDEAVYDRSLAWK
jgi:hypothetical protein